MVPKEWNWPVGASLSLEAGYQKKEYSEDDWNLDWSPDWELNFGYVPGFTQSTDNDILKVILGYKGSTNQTERSYSSY